MTTISHKTLSGSQLHEPKGIGSAVAGTTYVADGAGSGAWQNQGTLPRGYIDGCILANGADTTNDITISAGVCRDSTNTVDITVAAMATGKRLDANWAPGDTNGMRNSAVSITDTTYHIYAVSKANGTQDIYAHTSTTISTVIAALQAESGGASYLYARLIGSIVRASSAIIQFTQIQDYFWPTTPINDVDTSTLSTSSVTFTLSSIPTGLVMLVQLQGLVNHVSGSIVHVRTPEDTDSAPSLIAAPLATMGINQAGSVTGMFNVRVNTSARFAARASASSTVLRAAAVWWLHPRGKDS